MELGGIYSHLKAVNKKSTSRFSHRALTELGSSDVKFLTLTCEIFTGSWPKEDSYRLGFHRAFRNIAIGFPQMSKDDGGGKCQIWKTEALCNLILKMSSENFLPYLVQANYQGPLHSRGKNYTRTG